jgi:type I restriction-modification system DNA methylase subunit
MITLDQVYEELDFKNGSLFEAVESPKRNHQLQGVWLDKGEWLSAASRAGADRVFFIENDPVVVFTKITTKDLLSKIHALNRTWSLAKPRILFLESPGELTVIDLAKPPIDSRADVKTLQDQWNRHYLILLDKTILASQELQKFHRENIESGTVFSDNRFKNLYSRADTSLIRDLKIVRTILIEQGLSPKIAHALIGRSIFVRYLEDRGILTEDDFKGIARKESGRSGLLKQNIPGDMSERNSFFVKILGNKDFTYDLFKYLANHFNGDIFPSGEEEYQKVYNHHLETIQNMLLGNLGIQKKLFFYAYDFNIIPLELISSIYEKFYSLEKKEKNAKNKKNTRQRAEGAYYTPPVLAEFVCSRVLSSEVLKKSPRILDPACGSGIFLVEAFRRIVRHKTAQNPQKRLDFEDLKVILRDQIAGIEANPEAARITAFSLCLALLHYLNPPDIRTQIYDKRNKLPCLVASNDRSNNHLHCIFAGNTFDTETIESNPIWKEHFGHSCADIVIGNPPWGNPGKSPPKESKKQHEVLLKWTEDHIKPISDKESSQGFLWRSLDFLKTNGHCGMLVPASILTKQGQLSQQFRQSFVSQVEIEEIFNFSHVRKIFFHNSKAPFLFFHFLKNEKPQEEFAYWSVKATRQIDKVQTITVSVNDRHWVHSRMINDSTIWKILLYGSFSDVELINRLRNEGKCFKNFVAYSGQGLKIASQVKDGSHLARYRFLDIGSFSKYGNIKFGELPTKMKFEHLGFERGYSGKRLLVKGGITEKNEPKGIVVSRYENAPFCFASTINGFILKENEERNYKIFLGIFWSSLTRYFLFNTASKWGTRNSALHLHEILSFPIVYPESQKQANEIIRLVNNLKDYNPPVQSLLANGVSISAINRQRTQWETELDEAVFDLYKLNRQEIDLVRDCCNVTIPYFYDSVNSRGSMAINNVEDQWLQSYAEIFIHRWEPYLDSGTEMRWRGCIGADGNMVAVHFYIVEKSISKKTNSNDYTWKELFANLAKSTDQPLGTSQMILEGMVHILTDDGAVIIKRNEKRLWTNSKAREDAESTLCKSMLNDESFSIEGGR